LFEETWRCEVTGERVEQYYLNRKSERANIMRNNQKFPDFFSVDLF